MTRILALILLLGGVSFWMPSLLLSQETAEPAQGAPEVESQPLTIVRLIELLRTGAPSASLLRMVEMYGVAIDLTVEDVVRLKSLGATPQLIQALARRGEQAAVVAEAAQVEVPSGKPLPGALTVRRVVKMYRKSVPAEEIAAQVRQKGLKAAPELEELLQLGAQGIPSVIIRALAGGADGRERTGGGEPIGGSAGAGEERRTVSARGRDPLRADDLLEMLERNDSPASIVAAINERGMEEALTLSEAIELRQAGATDEILAAINEAVRPPEDEPPLARARAGEPRDESPPPESRDRVWIASVPPGARVFISPDMTRRQETFNHEYLVGVTPLSISLGPGEYNIVFQRKAGEFEDGLLPAWRTVHDTQDTRSILDNAHLAFDPDSCCLPGSLSGTVDVHPVPAGQPQGIIGDQFDGLPPYLFDGEELQIMRVRRSRITHIMKLYSLRKNAGQSRVLISTFIPAEGDPLEATSVAGLPEGRPYDAYLEAPALDYLNSEEGIAALGSALGVEPDHLTEAIAMLGRAGKAILHQQVEGGVRLLSIAVEDFGRLRVVDQTVRPIDPFAPPPDPTAKKKKKKVAPAPVPPPLPEMERTVIPGLGLPRLVIDNTSPRGLALLLGDGQFYFVPGRTEREFVIDPGTFDARVVAPVPAGTAPQGPLHFSYHARYRITF